MKMSKGKVVVNRMVICTCFCLLLLVTHHCQGKASSNSSPLLKEKNSLFTSADGEFQQQMMAEEQRDWTEAGRLGRDLFREYLSRGMLTCSAKYVGALQKLNKLVESAHREYTECKQQMDSEGSRTQKQQSGNLLLADQLEMISELFNESK